MKQNKDYHTRQQDRAVSITVAETGCENAGMVTVLMRT
jgi:hypothetical protein